MEAGSTGKKDLNLCTQTLIPCLNAQQLNSLVLFLVIVSVILSPPHFSKNLLY